MLLCVFLATGLLAHAASSSPTTRRVPTVCGFHNGQLSYRKTLSKLCVLKGGQRYFDEGPEYYDDEDAGYYQEYSQAPRRKGNDDGGGVGGLPGLDAFVGISSPNRKLGFMLSGSGGLVTVLGVMLFFNAFLLRIGNILFLAGLPMIIGPGRTIAYFTNPARLRATATFLVGVFLVVIAGWPMTGLIVEVFGFLNLFGNLFPLLKVMLRQIPGLPFGGGGSGQRDDYNPDYINGDYNDGSNQYPGY